MRKVESERNMSKSVRSVVIHTHFKYLEQPEQNEGFTHPVVEIPFVNFDQNEANDKEWETLKQQVENNTLK